MRDKPLSNIIRFPFNPDDFSKHKIPGKIAGRINTPPAYQDKPLLHSWNYFGTAGEILGVLSWYGTDQKNYVQVFQPVPRDKEGIEQTLRSLFGLEKLAKHPKNTPVFIVEDERSAAALQSLGLCAVTNLGGSNPPRKPDEPKKIPNWSPLNGFMKVILLPNNDPLGEKYINDVEDALSALKSPPAFKILRLTGLTKGGGVIEWLQNLICGWDGYSPIAESERPRLKFALQAEMKKAESVPDNLNLAILAGSYPSVFEWEKPSDIETKVPPVDTLRPELIPEPFRPWLADVSHRMQTPPDFSAISALVIVGSLIGAGCGIRPKRLDDWEVIPNIWGACIGRPSVVLKSPSMKEPMAILEHLQAEYGKQFEREKAGAEFETIANKAILEEIQSKVKSAAKGKGKDNVTNPDEMQKLKADYMELKEGEDPEPTRRLFKTNETSIQSMTVLQNQNERGILVFRDELTGLLVKWDREDGQDERAYFLEGWNGNGSYTDVKIGRGVTDAKAICISLLGGIQPDKLKRYLYQAMKGNNDGLMQRLQLAVWPDEPVSWELVDTLPNKEAKKKAFEIMKILADLDFIEYGAIQDEHDDRPYFRFSESGQSIFNVWLTELQTVKIQQEDNPLMVEHLGKFRSMMPSLALIFHLIEIADGKTKCNVSAKAARLAVEWCKYLESHARRIYAMAESPEHEAAVRLADKIKAKALPIPFTCKTVYDKGWHGLKDKQEVEAACNILIDENWILMTRKPTTGNRGRPPLPEYFINPIFL